MSPGKKTFDEFVTGNMARWEAEFIGATHLPSTMTTGFDQQWLTG